MYLCTALVTAQILVVVAVAIWSMFHEVETTYINASGEEIDISYTDTLPEIHELFKAVEEKNFETIYRYAAPELKEKVSYERFVRDQLRCN